MAEIERYKNFRIRSTPKKTEEGKFIQYGVIELLIGETVMRLMEPFNYMTEGKILVYDLEEDADMAFINSQKKYIDDKL